MALDPVGEYRYRWGDMSLATTTTTQEEDAEDPAAAVDHSSSSFLLLAGGACEEDPSVRWMNDKNLHQRCAPPVIYTAVLLHDDVNCNDTVTSALSTDDDEDEEYGRDCNQEHHDHHQQQETAAVVHDRFQFLTVALGLIVGFFIQFSSLGANFLLNASTSNTTTTMTGTPSESSILCFSLSWSFLTSLLGVVILMLLRCLTVAAWSAVPPGNVVQQKNQQKLVAKMESFFAVGALVGVCLAWTCTDLVLGLTAHVIHSLCTLAAALIWCKVISFCSKKSKQNNNCQSNALNEPLLDASLVSKQQYQQTIVDTAEGALVYMRLFQSSSLALGTVVGFFIQFSSLGANFLLTVLYDAGDGEPSHVSRTVILSVSDTQRNEMLFFSLAWSFATSSMGVLILILLRNLVLLAWSNVRRETCLGKTLEQLLWYMECFFATGALLGVNAAWVVTDSLLGLQIHLTHSILALVIALCWCKAVSCFFSWQSSAPAALEKAAPVQDNEITILVV